MLKCGIGGSEKVLLTNKINEGHDLSCTPLGRRNKHGPHDVSLHSEINQAL